MQTETELSKERMLLLYSPKWKGGTPFAKVNPSAKGDPFDLKNIYCVIWKSLMQKCKSKSKIVSHKFNLKFKNLSLTINIIDQ